MVSLGIFSVVPPTQNNVPWGRLSLWKWVPGISPGVKAPDAYGLRPTTVVVPNTKKIRGLNLPGTPWATSACCGRTLLYFTLLYFTLVLTSMCVHQRTLCRSHSYFLYRRCWFQSNRKPLNISVFLDFFQSLRANTQITPQVWPRLLNCAPFPT